MSLNLKRVNNFGDGVLALGQVDFLLRFLSDPNPIAAGLPPYAMALTCPLAVPSIQDLPPDCSAPATIQIERDILDGHHILTVKLSLGELNIVWLTEPDDPDIWMFIDGWRQFGVVPIVLGVEEAKEERYRIIMAIPECIPSFGDGRGNQEPSDIHERWASILAFCETHGAAFPLVSEHVPPLPRPDNFKALKYVKSCADIALRIATPSPLCIRT
ncbi:hypothetical protein [Cupriavidus metallidurans]|uniref:hypothetical protein n=1 Tax=Cupriavidus metallidurans TaxID=119219 RepID=UPI001267BDF9|nr:hypothetical protein [Cupriavidus metallidurans]QGS32347.1 hypothetical protein FOB83_26285 [Cupriavidus metallidurans]